MQRSGSVLAVVKISHAWMDHSLDNCFPSDEHLPLIPRVCCFKRHLLNILMCFLVCTGGHLSGLVLEIPCSDFQGMWLCNFSRLRSFVFFPDHTWMSDCSLCMSGYRGRDPGAGDGPWGVGILEHLQEGLWPKSLYSRLLFEALDKRH